MVRSLQLARALLVLLSTPLAAMAQDLVGCQLVDADLQCVPGVTESLQQQIEGLAQLVLAGNAADAQAALPSASYHWYRLQPGQRSWVLMEGAQGTSYVPSPVDIGRNLMVVAVVSQAGVVKRVASQPIGPVQP